MAIAKGSLGQINMIEESAYGVVGTTALTLPAIDFSLAMSQSLIESNVLRGDRSPAEPVLDEITVNGGMTIQPDVRSIGFILKHLIGAPTVTGVGPYTHTFKVAAALPPGITFEKWLSDVTLAFRYLGCKINRMTLEIGSNGLLTMSLDIIGQTYINPVPTSRVDATPTVYAIKGLRNPVATLSEGGSGITIGSRFSMEINNNLDAIRTIGNGGKLFALNEGLARASGTLTLLFQDTTQLLKAMNEVESSLILTFPATGGHSLQFEFQEVRFALGDPVITGPGVVTLDLAWQAFKDNGAGASAIIATLVNDVASYAAIP